MFLLGISIFKGRTWRRLYKSFGFKWLRVIASRMFTLRVYLSVCSCLDFSSELKTNNDPMTMNSKDMIDGGGCSPPRPGRLTLGFDPVSI
jgi:hypothetical protein